MIYALHHTQTILHEGAPFLFSTASGYAFNNRAYASATDQAYSIILSIEDQFKKMIAMLIPAFTIEWTSPYAHIVSPSLRRYAIGQPRILHRYAL